MGREEASMLTFLKCYHYHTTENIQMINKTGVVAIIRRVRMLSSLVRMEGNQEPAYTLLLWCCRHVTMQMKGCQTALQIKDRLHTAEQTSVSINMEACQALRELG